MLDLMMSRWRARLNVKKFKRQMTSRNRRNDELRRSRRRGNQAKRQINCPKSLFDQEHPNRNQRCPCKFSSYSFNRARAKGKEREKGIEKEKWQDLRWSQSLDSNSSLIRYHAKFGASFDNFVVHHSDCTAIEFSQNRSSRLWFEFMLCSCCCFFFFHSYHPQLRASI